jgi:hypothetical protein
MLSPFLFFRSGALHNIRIFGNNVDEILQRPTTSQIEIFQELAKLSPPRRAVRLKIFFNFSMRQMGSCHFKKLG